MNFINSWKSSAIANLQWDKLVLIFRLGPFTIFELEGDLSRKYFKIGALNFAVEFAKK